ncbi:hypothetical protein [Pseudonocardia acaciae]|uniref:hypothetical protein n=1 Tax=Pseudonocardia acaciae TaxID=551276 RepID=UPI000B1FAC5B|nr:hypothetical protein [Pseudonocardia acaciae]
MTRSVKQPPTQSKRGQLVDAATILALIFVTLFATTFLVSESDTAAASSGPEAGQQRQLADLPITPAERAQYQKLIDSGTVDLPAVTAAVDANRPEPDKYSFSLAALLGTAALLAAYLAFVYRASFREYREVIEEKFGPKEAP